MGERVAVRLDAPVRRPEGREGAKGEAHPAAVGDREEGRLEAVARRVRGLEVAAVSDEIGEERANRAFLTANRYDLSGNVVGVLAGMALVFSCTVSDVRAATAEEVEHGHVHGADGHTH